MKEDGPKVIVVSALKVNGFTRYTRIKVNHKRAKVLVVNGLCNKKGGPVLLTDAVKRIYARKHAIPVTEIQYWLIWGNQLRMDPNESGHDYPTGEALLEALNVSKHDYKDYVAQEASIEGEDVAWLKRMNGIRLKDYEHFISQLSKNPADRTEIMLKLDAFVGSYL
jgi:hypothetical protein